MPTWKNTLDLTSKKDLHIEKAAKMAAALNYPHFCFSKMVYKVVTEGKTPYGKRTTFVKSDLDEKTKSLYFVVIYEDDSCEVVRYKELMKILEEDYLDKYVDHEEDDVFVRCVYNVSDKVEWSAERKVSATIELKGIGVPEDDPPQEHKQVAEPEYIEQSLGRGKIHIKDNTSIGPHALCGRVIGGYHSVKKVLSAEICKKCLAKHEKLI